MQPILLYSNHYLCIPSNKSGSGLNTVVQSLPPGQFTVTITAAVLDKLEFIQEGAVACYGPGARVFWWMALSTVGDLILVRCMAK